MPTRVWRRQWPAAIWHPVRGSGFRQESEVTLSVWSFPSLHSPFVPGITWRLPARRTSTMSPSGAARQKATARLPFPQTAIFINTGNPLSRLVYFDILKFFIPLAANGSKDAHPFPTDPAGRRPLSNLFSAAVLGQGRSLHSTRFPPARSFRAA